MGRFVLIGLYVFTAGCSAAKTTEELLQQLKGGDPVLRREAARELASHEAERVVPTLTEALRDDNHYVRHDAATALGKFGPAAASAIPALTAALKDKEKSVRSAAAAALKKIGS